MAKTAFVTGSTGLLGSNLVFALREQGWRVKALVRSTHKAQKFLAGSDAEIVVGDMNDVAAFAPALQGVDALFHTAAYFREYYNGESDPWTMLQRINVDATLALLTAAEQAGVARTVYVSSSGVIGPRPGGGPADESTPPGALAQSNLYFRSKVLGEQAIAAWQAQHQMPVVLILPSAMVGPRDNAPTTLGKAIFMTMQGRQPAIPPGGFEFVDARDVAAAMIVAAERGQAGERYIISEGYHTMAEFVQHITQAAGVAAPRLKMNLPMALMAAHAMELMGRLTRTEPQLTTAAIHTMTAYLPLDSSKAQRELGFAPRPFDATIQDEVAWFRQHPLAD